MDISADKGQVVTLTCMADGSPPPSYIWYRNSDTIRYCLYCTHRPCLVEPTDISADKGQVVTLTCAALQTQITYKIRVELASFSLCVSIYSLRYNAAIPVGR